MTDQEGKRWANSCALCRGTRKIGDGYLPEGRDECPWCRAVRLRYGSYWYPITPQNEHLFRNPT